MWRKERTILSNTVYIDRGIGLHHLEIIDPRLIDQRRTETNNSALRIMHQSRPRYRQASSAPSSPSSESGHSPYPRRSSLSLPISFPPTRTRVSYRQHFVPCHCRIFRWLRRIRRKKPGGVERRAIAKDHECWRDATHRMLDTGKIDWWGVTFALVLLTAIDVSFKFS